MDVVDMLQPDEEIVFFILDRYVSHPLYTMMGHWADSPVILCCHM